MRTGRLIDAHLHLDLFPEPPEVLERIGQVGAEVVAVTNAPSVFWYTKKLASRNPDVHAAAGLHPELVGTHAKELPDLLAILPEVKFVGEVGLDYTTPDASGRREQRRVFGAILQKCSDLGGRVLSVHSRRAASDVLDMIKPGFPGTVILHWFSGTVRELERANQVGCFFSVNSSMVKSKKGHSLVRRMASDHVLTESDGPFVAIGKRPAEPADVELTVQALASVWGCEVERAAQMVSENFAAVCRNRGNQS